MARWLLVALAVAPVDAVAGKKKRAAPEPAPVEASAVVVAVPAPLEVEVPCPWWPGVSRSWRVVEERTGGVEQRVEQRLSVTVLERSDASTVVETRTQVLDAQADPALLAMSSALASRPELDVPVRLRYDHATGAPSLVNAEELTAAHREIGRLTAEAMALPPSVAAGLVAMLGDEAILTATAAKNVLPLLQFSCSALIVGAHPHSSREPNPLGGPPLAATGVTTVSQEAHEIVLRDVSTYQAADQLTISSTFDLALAADTGWVTASKSRKEVRAGARSQVDTVVVTIE